MYKIVVEEFGGIDKLQIVEAADPTPGPGQVVVRQTSIGMNHAELMSRRGEYRIASGDPPFTPGLEGGGIIEAVGEGVTQRKVGQRVSLSLDAPRRSLGGEGTYQSHYLTDEHKTVPVPDAVPDDQLGALWLAYLTAWGCLCWQQQMGEGDFVLIPAASSSVGLVAAQIVKAHGGIAIGTTTSPEKIDTLQQMDEAPFDHLVLTNEDAWWKQVKAATDGHGCDVIFDPVAAGDFLNTEIRLLADHGTLWVYGLLGQIGKVDVTPLIRKRAAIRGWVNGQLAETEEAVQDGYAHVLSRIADGTYRLPVAKTFPLRDVQQAHEYMEQGQHIGKLILIP